MGALAAVLALVGLAGGLSAQEVRVQNPFRPFDRARFVAEATELGASEQQLAAYAQEIDEHGLGRAADRLLRSAVPAFGAAVELQEAVEPVAALELAKLLAATDRPLLRAHLRYHLAEIFLEADDPERAIEVLGDYIDQDVNHSPLDGEVAYYYAQALAEVPYPQLAIPRFHAFLDWFPDASERFRAAAHQQVMVLERQQESQLHDLADRMKKTRRDLAKKKTNEPIQIEQQRYVEELQQLIEMYEELEKQAGGKASGNGPSAKPADQSALPGGDGSVGELTNKPTLADRWGDMKDRDREKIEAEVQNGLPPQYRKMLVPFYKKLGTGKSAKER